MAQSLDRWLTTDPRDNMSDEYDHDFDPEQICANCDCAEDECECDADDRDIVDGQFCVICQEEEDEPIHQEDDDE